MEALLIPAVIIISSIIALWMITSKKFRKEVGSSISDVVVTNSRNIAEGARRATVLDELEFLEELSDLGHATAETVVQARVDYQSIMKGV